MGKISKLAKIVLLSTIPLLFATKNIIAPDSYIPPISKDKIIVLDPGHSDDYPGTGIEEERILNLKLAKNLQSKLQKDGYKVYLTRTDSLAVNKYSADYNLDKKVNLEDERLARKQFGKDKGAYYFISIHFNASKDSKKTGTEFYIPGHWRKDKAIDKKRSFNTLERLNYYCEKSLKSVQKMSNYLKDRKIETTIYGTDIDIVRNIDIDKFVKKFRKQKRRYPRIKEIPDSLMNKADFPITFIIEVDYLTNKKIRKFANTNIEYYSQLIYNAFKYAELPKLLDHKKAKNVINNITYTKNH